MSTSPMSFPTVLAAPTGHAGHLPTPAEFARSQAQACRRARSLPFDTLRTLYWTAVRSGAIPRSLIAWGKFERLLDSAEALALGPWARRR